jgi:Fe-S-cluster-containing hydrogenase component 2
MPAFRTPVVHHLSALGMVDERPRVEEVCIGCELCAIPCPAEAVRLERRTDVAPPATFAEFHGRIQGRQS